MADEIDPWQLREQLLSYEMDRRLANPNPLNENELARLRAEADRNPTVQISDNGAYRIFYEIEDARTYQLLVPLSSVLALLQEVQVGRDLIDALSWRPEHQINFCDAEMYIAETRSIGWKPVRELAPKPALTGTAPGQFQLADRLFLETAIDQAEREFGGEHDGIE